MMKISHYKQLDMLDCGPACIRIICDYFGRHYSSSVIRRFCFCTIDGTSMLDLCECAIRDKVSVSFDPLGFMYKCWERIGDRNYAVGKVKENGEMVVINDKELKRELYGADPLENEECRKCEYLPLCHGGCPIQRIQNEFENYNNDLCTMKKGKLDKFLKIHLRLKERGFNNR